MGSISVYQYLDNCTSSFVMISSKAGRPSLVTLSARRKAGIGRNEPVQLYRFSVRRFT
jgi:hypothetical protein